MIFSIPTNGDDEYGYGTRLHERSAASLFNLVFIYIYIYGSVSIFQAPGWIARPSKKPN